MRKPRTLGALILATLLLTTSAHGWNDTGHKVVARIAWANMSDTTRKNVVALLMSAPRLADLRSLMPRTGPQDVRDRLFFVRAATWPDIVRDEKKKARFNRFHKTKHHFINRFFETTGPNGEAVDVNREPEPQPENVVERLTHYNTSVIDSRNPMERSTELAWILHLMGDIHQPLHCSARITGEHPDGDRGGNLFLLLGRPDNLHSYWDGILDLSFSKLRGETPDAFVDRLAAVLMAQNQKNSMQALIKPAQFEEWSKNGHAIAKKTAYPTALVENQKPDEDYRRQVQRAVEPAVALAGYRLAEMLDRLFGN